MQEFLGQWLCFPQLLQGSCALAEGMWEEATLS